MATRKPADAKEPEILRDDILFLKDVNFNHDNVCSTCEDDFEPDEFENDSEAEWAGMTDERSSY